MIRCRARLLRGSAELTDTQQCRRDVVETSRSNRHNIETSRAQFVDHMFWRAALPGQQQVRAQQGELFLIDRKRIANDRQIFRRLWEIRIRAYTDKHLACTRRKYEFRQMRRERDDSLYITGLSSRLFGGGAGTKTRDRRNGGAEFFHKDQP